MKYPVCCLALGYTRLVGVTLYDDNSREFVETTVKVAKDLISKGMVKGIKWKDTGEDNGVGGEFIPDKEFGMNNLLIKSGVGKYRPLYNDIPDNTMLSSYIVVRVLDTNKGRLYEVVSNKCQRVKLTEEQLIGLNAIQRVPGVFIDTMEDGTYSIRVCDGIKIENRVYDKQEDTQAEEPKTLEEVFEPVKKTRAKK